VKITISQGITSSDANRFWFDIRIFHTIDFL